MNKSNNPNKGLFFLYNIAAGRIILRIIAKNKVISVVSGLFMDSFLSRPLIKPFIKSNNINMDEFEDKKYKSFNDFFIRKLKNPNKVTYKEKDVLISCATSKLTQYKITSDLKFKVKNTWYSVSSLIKDEMLASKFNNGTILVFRLSPDDYHRYLFIDDCKLLNKDKVKGFYHSVNPVSYDKVKVFSENTRTWELYRTENFDDVIYVEVGALLVGRIVNHDIKIAKKGDEKGYFKYGGSTVILMFKEDTIKLDDEIIRNSKKNIETNVKYGQKIGIKVNK